VTATYTAEEILEITKARLASGLMPDDAGKICPDTRLLQEGDWYLALSGPNYDGHDFIGDAFAGGAIGAIVAERGGYSIASTSFPLLAVSSPELAYAALARNWRRRMNPKVVLVLGEVHETAQVVNFICQNASLSDNRSAGEYALGANSAGKPAVRDNVTSETAFGKSAKDEQNQNQQGAVSLPKCRLQAYS
jgi:hypothetical protein